MAIDYNLYLAGNPPVEVVAQWAFPALADRPTGTVPFLAANLDEKYGFEVVVTSGENAYLDVMTDDGGWEWEPETYVVVAFRLDKEADRPTATDHVLAVVQRVLVAADQDAALVLNGDVLLLSRLNGVVIKHRRDTWWSFHPAADQLIPG
ncbi:hypothetical protein BJ973_006259 [Actinoplanes tereljensis]|uniref:Uncharacterized protein n=1 Tax=Paractinoplanes tereljensis TaxID=571912 RepID=A0A919NJJ3_9ACTN|nr:SitI3 family protein [Actinoplanes tereljensis]GIF19214.1 hypothetical protein Ate02nite_19440 [Actinoplanes tereljensis]